MGAIASITVGMIATLWLGDLSWLAASLFSVVLTKADVESRLRHTESALRDAEDRLSTIEDVVTVHGITLMKGRQP